MRKGAVKENNEEFNFQDDSSEAVGVKQGTKGRNPLAPEGGQIEFSAQPSKSARKRRSKRKARRSTEQQPKNKPLSYESVGQEANNENYQKSVHSCCTEISEDSGDLAIDINPEAVQCFEKCYALVPCAEFQTEAVNTPEHEQEQGSESYSGHLSDPMCQPENNSVDLTSDCTELTICLIKLVHKFNPRLATCLEKCVVNYANEKPVVRPEPVIDPNDEFNSESPVALTEESEDFAQDHSETPPPDKPYFTCDDYRRCLLKLVTKVQPEMYKYVQQCAASLTQYDAIMSTPRPPSLPVISRKSRLKPCLRKMIRIFDPELNKCIEEWGL
ncbi:hypothetical protein Aperf_G00000064452 [Anoplocephala perfoliata]